MARFKIEYCCSKKEYAEAKHLIQEKYGIEYDPFNNVEDEFLQENPDYNSILAPAINIPDDMTRRILNGSMLQSIPHYWDCQKEKKDNGTGAQYTVGGLVYYEQALKAVPKFVDTPVNNPSKFMTIPNISFTEEQSPEYLIMLIRRGLVFDSHKSDTLSRLKLMSFARMQRDKTIVDYCDAKHPVACLQNTELRNYMARIPRDRNLFMLDDFVKDPDCLTNNINHWSSFAEDENTYEKLHIFKTKSHDEVCREIKRRSGCAALIYKLERTEIYCEKGYDIDRDSIMCAGNMLMPPKKTYFDIEQDIADAAGIGDQTIKYYHDSVRMLFNKLLFGGILRDARTFSPWNTIDEIIAKSLMDERSMLTRAILSKNKSLIDISPDQYFILYPISSMDANKISNSTENTIRQIDLVACKTNYKTAFTRYFNAAKLSINGRIKGKVPVRNMPYSVNATYIPIISIPLEDCGAIIENANRLKCILAGSKNIPCTTDQFLKSVAALQKGNKHGYLALFALSEYVDYLQKGESALNRISQDYDADSDVSKKLAKARKNILDYYL